MVLVILMMVTGMAFAADAANATVELVANVAGSTEFKLTETKLDSGSFDSTDALAVGKEFTVTQGSAFDKTFYYNIKSNVVSKFTVTASADKLTQTSNILAGVPAAAYDVTCAVTDGEIDFTGLAVKSAAVNVTTNLPADAPAGSYSSTVTFTVAAR